MKKIIYLLTIVGLALSISGCNMLERPSKSVLTDENYWQVAENIRLFVDGAYDYYFTGYNRSWTATHATGVYGNSEVSDDATKSGALSDILLDTPGDNWYRAEGTYWLARRGSAPWNFAWIRKWNILINRIEANKDFYTKDDYNHWMGVARFFRGWEYSLLVQSFGDVPYYSEPVSDTDKDNQYKDRDPRTTIMKACMEDFDFAIANVRANDGADYVNKYVVATIASRCMLFEGTWYIYHKNDQAMQVYKNDNIDDLAKTFLNKTVEYAEVAMNSGVYKFDTDYNALFGSYSKPGNEIMLYRQYSNSESVKHCVASYCNLREGQNVYGNLSTLKAWICNDGLTYDQSTATNASSFNMKDLVVSRDPRFEATFWGETVHLGNATGIYCTKFINREGPTLWYDGSNSNRPEYRSATNINGAPCVRYAETVLNWIEAKAELADKFGGAAVTNADLDRSINAIRNRPLAPEAVAKGVKKTAPLDVNNLPNDPARTAAPEVNTHAGVVNSPLIWEIRRERRMEFFMEHFRTRDIRRWGKLELMSGANNPDIMLGAWINLEEAKLQWRPYVRSKADAGKIQVQALDGTIIKFETDINGNGTYPEYEKDAAGKLVQVPATYGDGSIKVNKEILDDNAPEMQGFLIPRNIKDRAANNFGERQYLEPVCKEVCQEYKDNGYTITQNPGWPTE